MKIGIFGGRFRLPHIGQLLSANAAVAACNLDEVLWTVSARPNHKSADELTAAQRHELVKAAIRGNRRFKAWDIEICRQPEATDTVQLLEAARVRYKRADSLELFLLVSMEYLDPTHEWWLPRWRRASEWLPDVTIVTFPWRDDLSEGVLTEQVQALTAQVPGSRVELCFPPAVDLSATDIIGRIQATGAVDAVRYMAPDAVLRLVQKHGYYLPV